MNGVQKFNEKMYEMVKAEAKRRKKSAYEVLGDSYYHTNDAIYKAQRKH